MNDKRKALTVDLKQILAMAPILFLAGMFTGIGIMISMR